MTKDALSAFVHKYQIRFPIAIDKAATSGPYSIDHEKYQLQDPPSLVLIDQQGRIRLNHFGRLSDIQVGNAVGQLLSVTKEC